MSDNDSLHVGFMLLFLGIGSVLLTAANGLMIVWILEDLAVEASGMSDLLLMYTVGMIAATLGVLYPAVWLSVDIINDWRGEPA